MPLTCDQPRIIDDIRIPAVVERARRCRACGQYRHPSRFDQISNLAGPIYNWDGTPQRYSICQDCCTKREGNGV